MRLCAYFTLGHCYAGGLFLAMTHDFKVMRTERGWVCLPEINLKLTFPAGFLELAR